MKDRLSQEEIMRVLRGKGSCCSRPEPTHQR